MSESARKKPSLSMLIDCSMELFDVHCKDKDIGYLSGLQKLLELSYHQVNEIKGKFLKDVQNHTLSLDEENAKKLKQELYITLQNIENKVFFLRDTIKKKSQYPIEKRDNS